jgi:hypothetical protein
MGKIIRQKLSGSLGGKEKTVLCNTLSLDSCLSDYITLSELVLLAILKHILSDITYSKVSLESMDSSHDFFRPVRTLQQI